MRKALRLVRYFIMSENADRVILGFGKFAKGAWVEVPPKVYRSIRADVKAGNAGWKLKTENEKVEE